MLRVLVDTSVWIDHFKNEDRELRHLIKASINNKLHLLTHEMVIGEILAGGVSPRQEEVLLLKQLLRAKKVTIDEYEVFIIRNNLQAQGMGYVDLNLLASCKLINAKIFTRDKKLIAAAEKLGLNYTSELK